MNTIYLSLEASSGTFFERSKEPRDGFEKVETTNPQTGAKGIVYKRYLKEGIFGRLTSMYLKENKFPDRIVHTISVTLVDGEERFVADIPYKDGKGNIGSFAESFIAYMPTLVKDEAYRIFPYVIEDKENLDKNGKPRKNYGISVSYARLSDKAVDKENKIPRLLNSYYDKDKNLVKRDIPPVIWKENFDGTMFMDKHESNKFLYDILTKYTIEYTGGGSGVKTFNRYEQGETTTNTTAQKQAENVENVAETAVVFTEYDDELPF